MTNCSISSSINQGRIIFPELQVRRQDSVTGGAEINFGGARKVYLCEFERGTRNLSQSQLNEQGEDQRFKGIFRPRSGIQAVFPAENRRSPKKLKKKGLHPKTVMKSGVSSQKLRKYRW